MSAHDEAMKALAEALAGLEALTQIYNSQANDGGWFSRNEGRTQRIALAHVSSNSGVLTSVLAELTQQTARRQRSD